jgi:hypothetical protein
MPQFPQGLGLNLPNAFPRDAKHLSNLFQGSSAAVVQSESQPQYLFFSVGQGIKYLFELLF